MTDHSNRVNQISEQPSEEFQKTNHQDLQRFFGLDASSLSNTDTQWIIQNKTSKLWAKRQTTLFLTNGIQAIFTVINQVGLVSKLAFKIPLWEIRVFILFLCIGSLMFTFKAIFTDRSESRKFIIRAFAFQQFYYFLTQCSFDADEIGTQSYLIPDESRGTINYVITFMVYNNVIIFQFTIQTTIRQRIALISGNILCIFLADMTGLTE